MNKLTIAFFLVALLCASVFAQIKDEHHKFEFYGGFSKNQVDDGSLRQDSTGNFSKVRDGYNGLEFSGVGNISRHFGIKGSFSAAFRNRGNINSSVYNFLGGFQIKDNAKDGSRIRPFAHALVGIGSTKFSLDSSFLTSPFCAQPGIVCSDLNVRRSGFGAALGGGLDIKASRRLSIRAIQVDYNPIHPDTTTQNNVRIGFGVVFH